MDNIQGIKKIWRSQPVISKLKPTRRRFLLKKTGGLITATALVIVSLSLALLALSNSTSGLELQKMYFERAQLVSQIEDAHGMMVSNVLDYNLTGNLASLKDYQRAEVIINKTLNSFTPTPSQYLLYTSLQNYLVSLNEVLTTMTQLYDMNQDDEAIFLWRTKGSPLSVNTRAFTEQLIKLELEKASQEYTTSTENARNTAWLVIGLAGCALLLLTITMIKRAENALRKERDFALQVMNTIGQGLTVIDTSLNFQFVNPTFARLVGFSQADLKGKSALDFIPPEIHPTLKEALNKPEDEPGNTIEIPLSCRDGSVISTETTIVPLVLNGGTVGLINVFTDLTRHKEAEQELRKSLEDRRQYAIRLENLRQIDRVILEAESSQDIAMSALKQAELILGCDWSRVTGFDPETRKEIVLAARYNSAAYLSEQPWQEISLGSETTPTGDQVALNLPLCAGNNLVGYLSLGMNEPGKFRPDCLEIAREMAAQLAIGIQHAYLFEEVNQTQQRLKALSSSLLKAQEMERRRIARELHDEIGQAITALKISLQNLQAIPQPTEVRNQLEDSISIAHLTLQQVRALALELRPSMLDDLGLVAALRWYLDRVSNRAGLDLHFTVDSEFSERLPSDIETVCFRLVQEALTNIIRHARAEEVWVDLKIDRDTFFVSVKDDGVGFNVKEALEKGVNGSSMGLQGMLERVNLVKGDLKFTSSPQQGSFISAQFPVIQQKLTSMAAEL